MDMLFYDCIIQKLPIGNNFFIWIMVTEYLPVLKIKRINNVRTPRKKNK